jgi:ABC-type nitrate/sulfonate/bicarbonate transport system substrate-binding protein
MSNPEAIWYSHCGHSPLAVAIQNGWFADELKPLGIALKSVKRDGDKEQQLSHYDHHIPYSIRQGGNVPAIWARSTGVETRLVGINWLDEYQAVLALPSSGIKTGKDLKDRRLALQTANHPVDHTQAAHLRGYLTALELAGLSERDAEFVELRQVHDNFGTPGAEEGARAFEGGGRAVDALLNGQVDAIFVRGPHGIAIRDRLNATVVSEISAHPDPLVRANNGTPRPLTVHARFIEDHPELVATLVRRVAEAGPWAETHAREAAERIARQDGTSAEVVERAYGHQLQHRLHTTLNDTAIAGLSAYKDFLFQKGFIPNDFSITDWIDARPLEAAQTSAEIVYETT